jgi:hypothetical protein
MRATLSVPALLALLAGAPPGRATVPQEGLVASYRFNDDARDSSGRGHHGVLHGVRLTSNRLGDGSSAYAFDGEGAHIEIPDHDDFSLSTTGRLSISVWLRPGTLRFPRTEGTGYVHWLGKGVPGRHEWAFRMYSADNTEGRENRVSFYLFNPAGGLGAGSFVQDDVVRGTWHHHVAVVDLKADTIAWYKNGVLRDRDSFLGNPYHIRPRNGSAPVRIGTRDFASFFKGAIDNIHVYNRALSPAEVVQLFNDRTP